jgi:hypothetical protein
VFGIFCQARGGFAVSFTSSNRILPVLQIVLCLFSLVVAIPTHAEPPNPERVATLLSGFPTSFEPNQGQSNAKVKFLSRGIGYTAFFSADEVVLTLQEWTDAMPLRAWKTRQYQEAALRMQFVGANPSVELKALSELIGKSNYFIGNNPEEWRTGIAQFRRIEYKNIYHNIELLFYGNLQNLEYDFVVNPGGNPNRIRVRLREADQIRLDGENLSVKAGQRYLRFNKPLIYQETESGRKQVEGHFVVRRNEFSFRVGKYDHTKPLVIDPVLDYSVSLGGNGTSATSIAVAPTGEVFLAGNTSNPNFPATAGTFQTTMHGSNDAFVAKLDASGNVLWATYLGGSGLDYANGVAIDSQENVYVVGSSSSLDFPISSGAFQPTFPACSASAPLCSHAFVTALNSAGTALQYSSYLGSSGSPVTDDVANAVTVDASGKIFFTGQAAAPDFPTTPGALQSTFTGTSGISFVAKIDPLQSGIASLLYSTFLGGGDGSGQGNGIAIDGQGNAYVTGTTASAKFPTTPGAFLTTLSQTASPTGYVAELNSSGSSIIFGTYLGDTSGPAGTTCPDSPNALVVDSSGIYVVGVTMSRHFPVTSGAFQTTMPGYSAAFVSKLNPTGRALVYSTLLGGTGLNTDICSPVDYATGIVVDASGNAYVTGVTGSPDFPMPAASATLEPVCQIVPGNFTLPDCVAGFLSVLSPAGASLVFSSFLGGYTGGARLAGIAMDRAGKVYVTGSGTLPAVGGGQTTGSSILARIDINGTAPAAALLPLALNLGTVGTGATTSAQVITMTNRGNAALNVTNVSITGTPATGSFAQSNNCPGSLPPAGSCTINVSFTASALGASTGNLTVADSAFDSPQFTSLSAAGGTVGATTNTSSLGFGNQAIGTTSGAQSVTLSSTGDAVLSISSISVNGDFAETNNCGSLLAAGSSCALNVTFTPTTSGTRSGTLTITSNAPSSPQAILLGGTGVVAPGVSLTATSLTFASQGVGSMSAAQTVTLTNPTTVNLSITGISLNGTSAADFAQTSTCGSGVSGKNNCTISVTFTPSASGTRKATLNIADNAPDSPQAIAITGSGVSLGLTVSSAGSNTATVAAGQTASYSLAIGGGGISGSASFACTGSPIGAVCTVPSTLSVASGTASTFAITITTTSRTLSALRLIEIHPGPWAWAVLFFGIAISPRANRTKRALLRFAWLIPLAVSLCSCGGSGNSTIPNGTPAGTYTLTVTATSGSTSQSVNLTLIVQ